jgi:hypothetical protein
MMRQPGYHPKMATVLEILIKVKNLFLFSEEKYWGMRIGATADAIYLDQAGMRYRYALCGDMVVPSVAASTCYGLFVLPMGTRFSTVRG